MLYQLAGFGTLHYIVPRPVNWAINIGIFGLIVASYVANREGAYNMEGVRLASRCCHGAYRVLRRVQTEADADDLRRAVPAEASKVAILSARNPSNRLLS